MMTEAGSEFQTDGCSAALLVKDKMRLI